MGKDGSPDGNGLEYHDIHKSHDMSMYVHYVLRYSPSWIGPLERDVCEDYGNIKMGGVRTSFFLRDVE